MPVKFWLMILRFWFFLIVIELLLYQLLYLLHPEKKVACTRYSNKSYQKQIKNSTIQILWSLNYSNRYILRHLMLSNLDNHNKNNGDYDTCSKYHRIINVIFMPLPFVVITYAIKISNAEGQILSFYQGRSNRTEVTT